MAIDLTGISNINEFYSHHYLDSLLEGDLKGLYKKWKESDDRSPYEKLSGIANKYFKAKTDGFNEKKPEDRVEITRKFHINFLEALGYVANQVIKYSEDGQAIPVITSEKRDGNEYLWILETVFWSDDTSVFEQPLVLENNEDVVSWFDDSIDMAIQNIFRLDEPPRWLVLLAGQKAYLIDRNKWGQGKYLLFDLDELFGRKQAETLKATAALLSKDALAPEEGNVLHDELDENSHKHAFSVSEDLKYGIRRAVELIGNEFIHYRSKISKQKVYGDEELANKLTKESLTYLYRLLFLFYAESRSEELNVVPMKSEEYRLGYSLETLRELEQVPLSTEASREGYFLHESLTTLFKLVNAGFGDDGQFELNYESGNYVDFGFNIDGLQSPLFDSKETPLLSSVKFRNFVLQEVIQLLSLSKEGSKQRGRISYAQLGINQLGAVYEGLLSYSGFFAQETLYEVKPANVSSTDETGQSYFVPESEIGQYNEEEFVLVQGDDGVKRRKKYDRGSFIFRLAGRDREKSASYYTPEVLTKSLVKYSLKELLRDKTADDILKLTICEPAMGSGAFLNETINQLADSYLERKQKELGEKIKPENYLHEKQRVKAHLSTNNVYGIDLNSTAVELAKVSLWLNTIYEGAKTPWYSARLTVGNSLIGARKQFFKENYLLNGQWHKSSPEKVDFRSQENSYIYHFLVPDNGMVDFEKDKVVSNLSKPDIEFMKKWRVNFNKKFDPNEVEMLKNLSNRINKLFNRHLNNRIRMLEKTKDPVSIWGNELINDKLNEKLAIDDKENELNNIQKSPTSPYRALKMVMDYWCALWFWPIYEAKELPTRDEFLMDISVILDSAEGIGSNIEDIIKSVKRLQIVAEVAAKVNFVHWELEFAEIFEVNKGFDLVIGNPPWIKIEWKEKGVLSEDNPDIVLKNKKVKEIAEIRERQLTNNYNRQKYLNEYVNIAGQQSFLSSYLFKELKGVHLNLYKTFIILGFKIGNPKATISIIHQDGIYEDKRGYSLREFLYKKLVYYFQYVNELKLFQDINNPKKYGCSIFSNSNNEEISFYSISNLFHPRTIDDSFENSDNRILGIKDDNYKWEIRGNKSRIIEVNKDVLSLFNQLFEDEDVIIEQTSFTKVHSHVLVNVLQKLNKNKNKLGKIRDNVNISYMFTEGTSQRQGLINSESVRPQDINELVYLGPHFYVGNPLFKEPNENCKNNRDYSFLDYQIIPDDFIPRSNYSLTEKGKEKIPTWKGKKVIDYNRLIFRKMLDSGTSRTLITSLIPEGPSHTDSCGTIMISDEKLLIGLSGLMSSIVYDFYIKISGRTNLYSEIYNLPIISEKHVLYEEIKIRTLLINCVTRYYSNIWERNLDSDLYNFEMVKNDNRINKRVFEKQWKKSYFILNDLERRQLLLEMDAIAALFLNLTYSELQTIYKIQFPVLQKYESENYYDQNGMLVPKSVIKYYKKNDGDVDNNDPKLEGFIAPFDQFDRETDLREAYNYFFEILNGEAVKGEVKS
jgi:hypothetical protein